MNAPQMNASWCDRYDTWWHRWRRRWWWLLSILLGYIQTHTLTLTTHKITFKILFSCPKEKLDFRSNQLYPLNVLTINWHTQSEYVLLKTKKKQIKSEILKSNNRFWTFEIPKNQQNEQTARSQNPNFWHENAYKTKTILLFPATRSLSRLYIWN